jgi:hypothetical protein
LGWEPVWTFGEERYILRVPKYELRFPRPDHVPMSAELWEIKRDSVDNQQRFSIQFLLGGKETMF